MSPMQNRTGFMFGIFPLVVLLPIPIYCQAILSTTLIRYDDLNTDGNLRLFL